MTDNRGFIRHIGYDNADVFRNMLLDSYIAVQLLEHKRELNAESIKFMAEALRGSFSFFI